MQIRIPTRDCRVAVGAAIEALSSGLVNRREELRKQCLESIKAGAEHNGVVMTSALQKEMQEMAERDADHMMQRSGDRQAIDFLKNHQEMLDYHQGDDIVIDDGDFSLIKEHLPKQAARVDDEEASSKAFAEAVSQ